MAISVNSVPNFGAIRGRFILVALLAHHLLRAHALVDEDLIKFWIGHAPETVTDGYSKMKEDRKFRAIVAEQIGLGFHMPVVAAGLPVAPIAPSLDQPEMAVNA